MLKEFEHAGDGRKPSLYFCRPVRPRLVNDIMLDLCPRMLQEAADLHFESPTAQTR
jgi:hypothetical protein